MYHERRKALLSFLLLVVFLLPLIGRTFHICQSELHPHHKTETAAAKHHQATHEADDCAICQYVLLGFFHQNDIRVGVVLPFLIAFVAFPYLRKVNGVEQYVGFLRGPPALGKV